MKKILLFSAVFFSFIFFSSTAQAATISNGSFENGTNPGTFITLTPGSSDINNWPVVSGSIDYIGSYWQASVGSNRSIDLNGNAAGSISQTFPTVVGATYDVSFDLSGNPDSRSDETDPHWSSSLKKVSVSATGVTAQDYTFDTSVKGNSLSDMKWETNHYSFIATTENTTLTFSSLIEGAFGPALDNVSVTETIPTDPSDAFSCNNNETLTLLETVIIPAGQSTNILSTKTLENGVTYGLKAYGTANAGDNIEFDPKYSFRTGSSVDWTDAVSTYESYGKELLDLFVNDTNVDWGVYNTSHTYWNEIVGTGSPASFRIYDTYPSNNTGSLSVDIYYCKANEVPPVNPPTNKNQCKNNNWKNFNNPKFKNQGQCVSYVEHNTNHGQYVSSQENKNEAAHSDIGMPEQSKGHKK